MPVQEDLGRASKMASSLKDFAFETLLNHQDQVIELSMT